MRKHIEIDTNYSRNCHFINNRIECPYEEIGRKYPHEKSGNCKLGNNCAYSQCSFEHDLDVFVEDNVNQNHVHNVDDETETD